MQGTSKKRPNDGGGVVRHFKRPPEPDQTSKSPVRGTNGQERPRQAASAGNPSKRHRERLNTELDAVASLLPFESGIIARLDKLSVLRLAVSYLEAKTFFQVLQQRHYTRWPFCTGYSSAFLNPRHFAQEQSVLKALGGFIVLLNENGDIIYTTENIETLLGFHQSDTLHQPIFDMIHSEDRDELRRMLTWYSPPSYAFETGDAFLQAGDTQILMERHTSVRFRCFLDNTCGFMRVDIRGRLVILESCLPHCYIASRPEPNFPVFGLIAVCIPLVMPSHVDACPEEPFLRSKHALNLSFCSADPRLMNALEITDDGRLSAVNLYTFADPRDLSLLAEAHKQVIQNGAAGLLVYRLISRNSQRTYWFQSSCRLMMKNGKPDSISCSHRLLTEYEGAVLLSKRSSLAAKVLVLEDNMSSGQSHMNLMCGSALAQPNSASRPSPLPAVDFRQGVHPQIHDPHQRGINPGGLANQPSSYGTKSAVRFRSSGKRTRITVGTPKGQPQQQQPHQPVSQEQLIPPYSLYQTRQSRMPQAAILPYYLPSEESQQQSSYAQQVRQYGAGQVNPVNQTQQATELQLHYHLHQHYGSPYYNNTEQGSLPKQALSPVPTSSVHDLHQQQFQLEPLPEQRTTALWLCSPNQGQPTAPSLTADHRAKAVFSIQEVTNTLLSQ